MQLLINIPDEKYNKINSDLYATFPSDMKEWGLESIKNGIPLSNKKWIKTSDCKPPIYEDVIITGKKKYKYEKNYDYFVDVAVRTPDDEYIMFNDNFEGEEEFNIIAWQYMPEPYIESEV